MRAGRLYTQIHGARSTRRQQESCDRAHGRAGTIEVIKERQSLPRRLRDIHREGPVEDFGPLRKVERVFSAAFGLRPGVRRAGGDAVPLGSRRLRSQPLPATEKPIREPVTDS